MQDGQRQLLKMQTHAFLLSAFYTCLHSARTNMKLTSASTCWHEHLDVMLDDPTRQQCRIIAHALLPWLLDLVVESNSA